MRLRGRFWEISFVDNDGRRHRKSTQTGDPVLAQQILDAIKGEIAQRKYLGKLPGESIPFSEMMARYQEEHASKLASAKDIAGYAKNLMSFFGDCMITKITASRISAYKAKRRKDGRQPATINRELSALRKAFSLAVKEWEWVNDNPVLRVSMERENNKRDRWLRDDEEARLLAVCAAWLREIVIFALNTGMRLSEILRLIWKDVDLTRRVLVVMKSKNTQKRTIPINATVFRMLWVKAQNQPEPSSFVFPSQTNTKLSRFNVSRAFRKAVKKAEIEDFRFHDLRHSFGSRLVQMGKDIYKVQILLGHKTPAMTQRYSHHYPESLRDAVEVLDGQAQMGRIQAEGQKKELPFFGNSLL